MWQDECGKGLVIEHVIDYQIRLSFYVNFIIYLYNFICVEINYFICLYNLNNIDEEGLYSSPDPMILLKRKIIKANKELDSLSDRLDQTPDVLERINLLMSQLNTYKVITII
jgi:hypothetical protein